MTIRLKLDVAFGYHTVTEGPFDYVAVYHAADRDMYLEQAQKPLIIRMK